jgi:hypothetical protein
VCKEIVAPRNFAAALGVAAFSGSTRNMHPAQSSDFNAGPAFQFSSREKFAILTAVKAVELTTS